LSRRIGNKRDNLGKRRHFGAGLRDVPGTAQNRMIEPCGGGLSSEDGEQLCLIVA
jgi:hypothetical protein